MAGLLKQVLYVGERKGGLTVLTRSDWCLPGGDDWSAYEEAVDVAAQSLDDPWSSTVALLGQGSGGIIDDDSDKVETYLCNIKNLWGLGAKPFRS